jgi:hypothetical protein
VAPPEIESVSACSLRLEAVDGQFRFGLDVFHPLKIEASAIRQVYDSGEEFTVPNLRSQNLCVTQRGVHANPICNLRGTRWSFFVPASPLTQSAI